MSEAAPSARGLVALEARLRQDLDYLNYPPRAWPCADGGALQVLVVGAGMLGLVAAFALRRQGVADVRVVDAREAGREGPWLTYARMRTLRSPKYLTGPAMGLPSLTFRAWFVAQWGDAAWTALDRIPRETWMDYLAWYRRVLAIPVQNAVRLTDIEPLPDGETDRAHFGVTLSHADGREERLRVRKVVLASGREGLAAPRIPPLFAPHRADPAGRDAGGGVARRCWHSAETIDFAALAGQRVAVLGLGASALDNAAVALESGAAAVHLLARARRVPRINKAKGIVYAGFTEGFPALPAALRFELLAYIAACKVPPPRASVERVASDSRFSLHLGAEVREVRAVGAALRLQAGDTALDVDAVILATGFRIDVQAAPELARLAPHIALWRDRYTPPPAQAGSELLDFPWLDDAMAFTEREPGTLPALAHLHCFNYAAAMSHGNVSGDIPSISEGAERMVRGLVRDLFIEEAEVHRAQLMAFDNPELEGDELALEPEQWWPPVAE